MRKYIFSLLIQDVSWPSTRGEITFESLNNLNVAGIPVKWTSSLKLELILSNLSYHYAIVLENPVMGRVDVFSRSRTRDIASEIDIVVLLREFKVYVMNDITINENFLPGSFIPKTTRRFLIDEWSWDPLLGGFIKEEETPFDVDIPNMSFVYSNKEDWSALASKISRVCITPIPTRSLQSRALSMRTSCNLIIDEKASKIDFRVLNMDFINSNEFLVMRYEDYHTWIMRCSVYNENPENPHSLIEVRKSIDMARANGKYCVNPLQIHWRTATWDQKILFEHGHPSADWKFLVFVSASGWANMLPFTQNAISRFHCPVGIGSVFLNAIRLEDDVRGLTIRSHFVTQTAAEKIVAARFIGHNKLMQAFGLHALNGKWTSKPSMLAIHKVSNILGSNLIDLCFDGFAKDEAHKLLEHSRECSICSTEMSTSLLDYCGHVFCESCIKSHISYGGDTCPICRAELQSWTTIKRSTNRRKIEEHLSKKIYLEEMPLEGALVVVPTNFIAEVIETWIPPHVDRVSLESSVPQKKYEQLILLTSYIRTASEVAKLHKLFQDCMQDGTVLHVLMDDNLPPWLDDFASCYKGLVQVSVYR